jgi:prevent-host-death family protein
MTNIPKTPNGRNWLAMSVWQAHSAKAHFSELLRQAESEGPQVITRHDKEAAVVLSVEDYRRLEAAKPDFKEYLVSGPKVDALDIARAGVAVIDPWQSGAPT